MVFGSTITDMRHYKMYANKMEYHAFGSFWIMKWMLAFKVAMFWGKPLNSKIMFTHNPIFIYGDLSAASAWYLILMSEV